VGLALIPFVADTLLALYATFGITAFTWNFVNTTGKLEPALAA
jgi:hypothetical protein